MEIKDIDYGMIGLRVGLECHQQLDTVEKLFCSCKPQLFKGDPEITFLRRLRPTQSELGQVDPAAYFEFTKGLEILYETDRKTSCLVEMDEEPPHELNKEALEIGLTLSLMLNAKPVDEVHVMRKIVIDGSNTTGFQRTCVVALDGMLEVDNKMIPIQHVGLEEDAARKIGGKGFLVRYRIDRLGIPLIEVATGPVIRSPKEAGKVAFAIGQILRALGLVKRGIGGIRQDLNISIRDGSIIEIKGVQKLEIVPNIVEYEVQRQLNLLRIRAELEKRGLSKEDIQERFIDVTTIFQKTRNKPIKKTLDRGGCVLSVKLPKFSGLLTIKLGPTQTFGSELADIARFWGRVERLFYSDNFVSDSIAEDEVSQLLKLTEMKKEDSLVFIADDRDNAIDALKSVVKRVREAFLGVPSETRAPKTDGTSRYSRPRPGSARMYPETDIPPTVVSEVLLSKLRLNIPENPKKKMERLMSTYSINKKLAGQLLHSNRSDLFESIARKVSVSPTFIAASLTEHLRALKRDNVNVDQVSDQQIKEIFYLIEKGQTTKEALPKILTYLAEHNEITVLNAIKKMNLEILSEKELAFLVDKLVDENRILIIEKKDKAFKILMGILMKDLRGRVDAFLLSKILREKLQTN